MRYLQPVLYTLFGGAAGGAVVWFAQGHSFYLRPAGMSYADFAGILLTAASLIVAIAGFAVALLGLWGYTQFQKIVSDGTQRAVIDIAPGLLADELRDGASKQVLIALVAQYLINAGEPGVGTALSEGREHDLAVVKELDSDDREG